MSHNNLIMNLNMMKMLLLVLEIIIMRSLIKRNNLEARKINLNISFIVILKGFMNNRNQLINQSMNYPLQLI